MNNIAFIHYGLFHKAQKATTALTGHPERLIVLYSSEAEADKALKSDFTVDGDYYEVKPINVYSKHIKPNL